MKIGIFGPIGGIAIAALVLWVFVHFTPTDSPMRWVGFGVAFLFFAGGIALALRGEKKNTLNDKAGR